MQAEQPGYPIRIMCSSTVLEWTFNNQTLPSNVIVSRGKNKIIIPSVQINHTGTYRCLIVEHRDGGEPKETWEASALYVGGYKILNILLHH